MQSRAKTVAQYLAELPPERRASIQAVREVVLANLDDGYEEGMQYGMIGYYVPHRLFPAGYHCDPEQPLPFAALASQKNHMALYLGAVYADERARAQLHAGFAKAGKKLDMGKSCIRFRKLADLPLDVIGAAVRRVPAKAFIAQYERSRAAQARAAPARKAQARARPAASGTGRARTGTRKKTARKR